MRRFDPGQRGQDSKDRATAIETQHMKSLTVRSWTLLLPAHMEMPAWKYDTSPIRISTANRLDPDTAAAERSFDGWAII
jgi:hypothetical protein